MVFFGQRAEMAKSEQPGIVAVAPGRLDRVAADQLEINQFRFVGQQRGPTLQLARVLTFARTRGARTAPAQVLPVIVTATPVTPREAHAPPASIELDVGGCGRARRLGHTRLKPTISAALCTQR